MILINEIVPIKLSGQSSLLVQFDYNEKLVEVIKKFQPAIYHKKIQAWEISISCLRDLLDELTYYDDIEFKLRDFDDFVSGQPELTESEINSFKFKPFKHQVEAINFCFQHPKYLLLDSMGLGKTNTIIWTAESLKSRGLIDHCLIVCGVDSLRQNWKNEIKKFSNESCLVLGEKISKKGNISYETVPKRAEQLKNPIEEFFIIVNAATLRNDKFIEAFKKSKNHIGMIAVDEVHKFATKTSQQGGNLLKMTSDFKIAATGTPIINSPISIYVPLAWTENDHATLTNFKAQYCNFGGFNNSQVTGYKNLELLNKEIHNCSLRRTLDQVRDDMPPKTVTTEIIEMSDEHKKFYEAIKMGVKEEADKIELNADNLLALATRLRQATADPGILSTEDITSSKIDRCVELVDELIEQGEKVVVLSSYKDPVHKLAKLLERYHPLVVTGDTKPADADHAVVAFQEDPNEMIIIGTHGKLGTGFTLNAASYMICLDEFWTAAQNNQSFDRIYRVNNTRPAFITVLICKDTIDEHVHDVAATKQELSDFMIDGKDNNLARTLRDDLARIIKEL